MRLRYKVAARFEPFLFLMPSVMFMFSDKLQIKLRAEGGIRALLAMVRCRHPDVLAQVARGMANFAKCESRASTQGIKSSRCFCPPIKLRLHGTPYMSPINLHSSFVLIMHKSLIWTSNFYMTNLSVKRLSWIFILFFELAAKWLNVTFV